MPGLEELKVIAAKVSNGGIERLKRSRPDLKVIPGK
jgi:hypothetical protein